MPRYELIKGKKQRFWEYEVSGKILTTRFGDIGGKVGEVVSECDSARDAKESAKRIAGQQEFLGFKLVDKPTVLATKPAKATTGGAQRYELSEGSSHKFWQIELTGTTTRVTYGKIGSTGQTQIKQFKDAAAAQKAHDALIAEKTKKGYTLVGGTAATPAKAAPTKPAKAAKPAKPVDTARLAKAIERCKKWMAKNGAEVLVKNLAKPASDATIAKLSRKLGFDVPAELAALWKIHDGQREEQNGFIGSLDLLSSGLAAMIRDDVLESVRWMLEDDEMVEDAELKSDEADERWIPFGSRDSDHLVVHAATGRVFRVAKDAPPLSLDAKNLTEFFEDYAKAMESGDYTVEEGFGDVYLAS